VLLRIVLSCAAYGVEHVEVAVAGPPQRVGDRFELAGAPAPVLAVTSLATQGAQADGQLFVEVCAHLVRCGGR
jgi:hypothetical protein